MKSHLPLLFIPLFVTTLVVCPGIVQALDTYTDRSTWTADTKGLVSVEDCESETVGQSGTPYITNAGFNIDAIQMGITVGVQDNGLVNNSREFHLNVSDMANRIFFSFPAIIDQIAFGFDWVTGNAAWELKVAGQTIALPDNSSGFVGVVDTDGTLGGFELTSAVLVQDGISIDDLSYNPSLLLFDDRVAWEGAIVVQPQIEDFEDDTADSYTTPYTTANGCVVSSLDGPNSVEIQASGPIGGTQELKLIDESNDLSIGFPGGAIQKGVGFDWKTGIQTWSLQVLGETYTLFAQSSGFFGFVDQTGTFDSFTLVPATINHGDLNIDDLAYTERTVPVLPTTWGRIKTLYGN